MQKLLWNIILLLVVLTGSFVSPVNLTPVAASEPTPLIPQITTLLTAHSLLQSRDAQVLDVSLEGEAILINLSRPILKDGAYDADTFAHLTRALDAELQLSDNYFVTFLVEGQTLEHWGMPVPEVGTPAQSPNAPQSPTSGPLSGKKIALNPGHGLYDKTDNGAYAWQRGEWWGIREDLVIVQDWMMLAA